MPYCLAAMFRAEAYELIPLRTETLPPSTHTNCVVAGRTNALVIDPGSPFRPEQRRLTRRLDRLLAAGGTLQGVFLTHHHHDHAGGVVPMCRHYGLPLLAHPETLDRIAPLPADVQARPLPLDARLTVDDAVTLEPLHTRGHARGHLCLWDARQRVLVSGDMVLGGGRTTIIAPPEGDMALYMETLQQLMTLNPRVILPGHGPVVDDGEHALRKLFTHRRWREWKVLMALEPHPRALMDLTLEAYEDLPSPLSLPLAARSTLAHLLKLEREGQAHRDSDERWQQVTEKRMSCARRGP